MSSVGSMSGNILNLSYADLKSIGSNSAAVSISCDLPIASFAVISFKPFQNSPYVAFVTSATVKMAAEISAIKLVPVQVVGNPKIAGSTDSFDADFILGKSAGFKVFLAGTNLDLASGTVQVEVLDQNNNPLEVSGKIDIQAINTAIQLSGSYPVYSGFMSVPFNPGLSWIPQTAGPMAAKVKIILNQGTTKIGAAKFTKDQVKKINVHQVIPPKFGIVKVQTDLASTTCPNSVQDCTVPTDQNFNILLQTTDFLSRVFPVPDSSISFIPNTTTPVPAVPVVINATSITPNDVIGLAAVIEDLMQLQVRLIITEGAGKMIGVVPNSYFKDHYYDGVTGIALFDDNNHPQKSALVTESHVPAVPHELGHLYGVNWEEYKSIIGVDGKKYGVYDDSYTVKGFDAVPKNGKRLSYTWPFPDPLDVFSVSGMSFMGPSKSKGKIADLSDLDDYWVDNAAYNTILRSVLLPLPQDPPILVVSGILNKSGTFGFRSSIEVADGTATPSDPEGDIAISTVDITNKLVSTVWVKSNYKLIAMRVDGGGYEQTILESETMPIVVTLPQDSSVEFIQVFQNGKVLQKTSLKSQMLSGIVSRIPDNAFKTWGRNEHDDRHPIEKARISKLIVRDRKLLSRKITRIKNLMNSKKPISAIEPLQELIEEIERITIRNYTTSDTSELTQHEVISQIRAIVISLEEQQEKGYHSK